MSTKKSNRLYAITKKTFAADLGVVGDASLRSWLYVMVSFLPMTIAEDSQHCKLTFTMLTVSRRYYFGFFFVFHWKGSKDGQESEQ